MPKAFEAEGQRFTLMPATTITTAVALTPITANLVANIIGCKYLAAIGKFVYGSGGTSAKVYIQTSFDAGLSWHDVICFAFAQASLQKVAAISGNIASAAPATPTDGTLADNTMNNGLLGDRFRAKYVTTGTYAGGTTLEVDIIVKA